MLTIAGSGVNSYLLKELSQKIQFKDYDCIITDINFDNPENKSLIPSQTETIFLQFKEIRQTIKDKILQGKTVLYIVTGSPVFFSAANKIIKYLKQEATGFDPEKVDIIPAESSKDYLLRKLKITDNDVTSLSLHGRDELSLDLTRFLSTKYTFLLCDGLSIKTIAQNTKYISEFLTFYIGIKLGSNGEEIKTVNILDIAEKMTPEEINNVFKPYVMLIERNYDPPEPMSCNEDFQTKSGMLTKTDKRMITLQLLKLKPNLLMWDIGAGAGSVSIDAYKIFRTRTVLFEKNEQQCEFIRKNLSSHKIAGVQLIEGNAINNFNKLPKPDRIFIGGGGEEVLKKLPKLYNELKDDGILVSNIIGLENLAQTVQTLRNSGLNYEVRSIDITNYKKISKEIELTVPEPERTLFQVIMRKYK